MIERQVRNLGNLSLFVRLMLEGSEMILRLKEVTFGFSPQKPIFADLSFGLTKGRVYALLGPNGSGKTTLFNIITGYYKSQSGEVLFNDRDITHEVTYKINRAGIGRSFQESRLVSKLSVRDNILLAMQNNPTDNVIKAFLPPFIFRNRVRILEEVVETILTDYFLSDVRTSCASGISFGQQKLLSLACCVANGADLLLLDEPVAGISPEYRAKIGKLIQQLKERGKTVLLIEHDTDFVAQIADSFLLISEGIVSAFDNFAQLQNSQQASNAYF